mmetsp:Transcript_23396/g.38725  ORF Transcript_23396/g.38725 Transcript_23396/m.38725 type:complete len:106 (-) Transcript_23396:430-747(-)|eukprot:CAMPEP_0119010348 /NCGR_PEP_ID=MMETSP1176-20130426/4950_1 /TAXON_ID=265551 /ORGANISM="Synedropsis recta cf, Strain CCMP1620" /LENGTH=105 /DNA_ID=CAMNT_0006962987 /DNA_START=105 /DNA_END=422 /DNA_ORIENTATION=-
MDISTPEEVKKAAEHPDTLILDVRTVEELQESSLQTRDFKHAACQLQECSDLMSRAEELFPNKTATIIVFCRSGRRAGKAKEMLQSKGYTSVLNAGGLSDLSAYL